MNAIPLKKSLGAAVALALSGSLYAQDETPAVVADAEENPTVVGDETWISLGGTVTSTSEDSFRLDYGDGIVTVEMDEWGNWAEEFPLTDGDKVTVHGEVDENVYINDTIEAASVYVEDLNTYFYASSADEEDVDVWAVTAPIVISQVTVRGTVTSTEPGEREFTLDTENQELTVEAEFLGYNPLDDVGYQKIEVGDRVSVTGEMDYEFFEVEGSVFEAETLVELAD